MTFSSLTPSVIQGNPPAEAWDALVHTGLAGRKNGSTEAQIQRLTKTLQRLYPTAIAAMDLVRQTGLMPAASRQPEDFASALVALSDG